MNKYYWAIGFEKETLRTIIVGPLTKYEDAESKSIKLLPNYFPFGLIVINNVKDYKVLLDKEGKIELNSYLEEHYGYDLKELKEIVKERGWGEDW